MVELDVLTGEYHVLSTDIVYDAGTSLNPSVDIGQIEGSFVQAAGMCLTEGQVQQAKRPQEVPCHLQRLQRHRRSWMSSS